MVDISVVTVTWNSGDTIALCLKSVLAECHQLKIEVIVVDNQSSDDTCNVVSRFPEVRLVKSNANVGFARACNHGISLSKGRYVMLLNPDSQVTPGMLSTLMQTLESSPSIVAAGPKILTPSGEIQRECGRKYIRFSQYLGSPGALHRVFPGLSPYMIVGDESDAVQVEALSGACMMVRRVWIDTFGGLDEQMFMYVEDVDWCYRMGSSGFQVWYQPNALLRHIGGASARKASLTWAQRVHYGGQLAFHRYFTKVYGRFNGTLGFLALFPIVQVQLIVKSIIRGLGGDKKWVYQLRKYCSLTSWMKVVKQALTGESYSW